MQIEIIEIANVEKEDITEASFTDSNRTHDNWNVAMTAKSRKPRNALVLIIPLACPIFFR